jgi:hypothetical protein
MMKVDNMLQSWRFNFTAVGLGVAVLYWLVESLLHTFLWHQSSFWEALHGGHDLNEITMRLIIVTMMVGFGYLAEQGKRHYHALATKHQNTNRLLRFLSECNQHVQRQLDEQSLMDAACRAAVDLGGFRFAWVGMQRPEGFRLVAWASSDPALDEHAILLEEHAALLSCLGCQKVLKEGVAELCDISSRKGCSEVLKEAFINQGCEHAYVLPLMLSGKVVGIFEIYAGEQGKLSEDELPILDEAADDVSVSLTSIHIGKERQEKAEELQNRIDELERFQKATVQREFRIKELRDEIEQLQGDVKRLEGEKS